MLCVRKEESVQPLSRPTLQPHKPQHARPLCPSPTPVQHQPKPMSIESVMSSNYLILFHPLLLLPSIFPSIRVFSNEKGRIVDIKSEFKCLLLFSTTRINFPMAMCVFGHVHMFLCKNIYLFEPPYTSKTYEKLNFPGKRHGNPLQYSCLKIPWTEEPGGLHSMESQRIGHD